MISRSLRDDYARFVECFVEAGIDVRAITFQGYEVTLPASWPYLEATFTVGQRFGLRRSFITNGMLLHKWTNRIVSLAPHRITVSIDGSSSEVNDPIRGIRGAFRATTMSVRRMLGSAPKLGPRLAIASTLFGEENYASLLGVPVLARELGVTRWMVSAAATYEDGKHRIVGEPDRVLEVLRPTWPSRRPCRDSVSRQR